MKCASPTRQSTSRSLVRNDATTIRARLCIQPVASELAHRGIDERVAGPAGPPGVDADRRRSTTPIASNSGRKRAASDLRPMEQDVRVELAPDELVDEDRADPPPPPTARSTTSSGDSDPRCRSADSREVPSLEVQPVARARHSPRPRRRASAPAGRARPARRASGMAPDRAVGPSPRPRSASDGTCAGREAVRSAGPTGRGQHAAARSRRPRPAGTASRR